MVVILLSSCLDTKLRQVTAVVHRTFTVATANIYSSWSIFRCSLAHFDKMQLGSFNCYDSFENGRIALLVLSNCIFFVSHSGASLRYLASQYLADSSLSEEVSQFDFSTPIQVNKRKLSCHIFCRCQRMSLVNSCSASSMKVIILSYVTRIFLFLTQITILSLTAL